jgi:hypothetical protein
MLSVRSPEFNMTAEHLKGLADGLNTDIASPLQSKPADDINTLMRAGTGNFAQIVGGSTSNFTIGQSIQADDAVPNVVINLKEMVAASIAELSVPTSGNNTARENFKEGKDMAVRNLRSSKENGAHLGSQPVLSPSASGALPVVTKKKTKSKSKPGKDRKRKDSYEAMRGDKLRQQATPDTSAKQSQGTVSIKKGSAANQTSDNLSVSMISEIEELIKINQQQLQELYAQQAERREQFVQND